MNATRILALLRCIGLVSFACLLTACTLVPKAENTVLYQLTESTLEKSTQVIDRTLKVMTIDSSDALNNRRLLVSDDGAALQSLPGARWVSPTRTMVRDRLLESFAADGRIARLTSDDSRLRGDLELHGSLRNFEGDFSADQPAVYLRLDANLADGTTRKILASKQFKIKVASKSKNADDVVRAFSMATDQLALEVLNWIAATASKPDPE